MNVVQNELYLICNCCNPVNILLITIMTIINKIFNLDVVILNMIHELTPRSSGWQLTQKPYKNRFLFQKECSRLYDFCREADRVSQTNCVCIIHHRAIIFGTYILYMSINNNIKEIFT